jgi:hypothetical protein
MSMKWLARSYAGTNPDDIASAGLSQNLELDDVQYPDSEDSEADPDVADFDVPMAPVEARCEPSKGSKAKRKHPHFKTVLNVIDDAVFFH